jgi:hypothetical protein
LRRKKNSANRKRNKSIENVRSRSEHLALHRIKKSDNSWLPKLQQKQRRGKRVNGGRKSRRLRKSERLESRKRQGGSKSGSRRRRQLKRRPKLRQRKRRTVSPPSLPLQSLVLHRSLVLELLIRRLEAVIVTSWVRKKLKLSRP